MVTSGKMGGTLIIGKKSYKVINIPEHSFYRILDPGCSVSIYKTFVDEVADVLATTYRRVGPEKFKLTNKFDSKKLREDLLLMKYKHIPKDQAEYLKKTRQYWEDKYTNGELRAMIDLLEFFEEFDVSMGSRDQMIIGKGLGDEWYELYENIKGDLPEDYPHYFVWFGSLIDNVTGKKFDKIINRTVRQYFKDRPGIENDMRIGDVPDDLILDWEIGLEPMEYFEYSRELRKKERVEV